MAFECMDDCVHLKACRRVQKIGRSHRLLVPRYCDEECSAYVGADEIDKEIQHAIRWAFESGRDGNDYITADTEDLIELIRGEA